MFHIGFYIFFIVFGFGFAFFVNSCHWIVEIMEDSFND